MRTNYFFCCLLLGCTLLARAESQVPTTSSEASDGLSLQQAMDMALNANTEIAVALREREAVEGMQLQAAARPNPVATARIEDLRSNTRESTLEVSQPIELGSKRAVRMQAAGHYLDSASADIALKKAEIQANVIAAFYGVMAAQERLELAEHALAVARNARNAISRRVEAGKISPVEETRSRIAESGVRIQFTQAKSALAIARKQLATLWGETDAGFTAVRGSMDAITILPSLEQLNAQLDQAPALQRAKLEVDTRQALVDVEKTKATPDISVTVGAKRNEELGLNQAVLGLSVPIPLFDRNQGNIQEALSRTDKARAEVAAMRAKLSVALAHAHERWQAARQTAASYQSEILPDAQSAFDAISKGAEFGKFNFHEVLDAQRTLNNARTQYLDVMLQAHQAVADISRILGDSATWNAQPKDSQ